MDVQPRVSLSAVIITLNAAATLERCLQSVAFADEIVVVDSGSDDATLEIAARHNAKVINEAWRGFGAQKNFAVGCAQNDWVFCIDADEQVSEALRQSIVSQLNDPRHAAYRCARRNRFLGRWLRHGEGYPDWNIRLFDRRRARWTEDPVHENVITGEAVGELKGDLLHESQDTLAAYLAKQNRYTSLQAQQLFLQGRRAGPAQLLLSPLIRFIRMTFLKLGVLDGLPGIIHISIGCMNSFTKYAKLIELQSKRQ